MIELYKKEIATFFCSPIGYLVVGVFLVLVWLLLWVVPSELNILYGGYATLSSLFDVAPWIYLFLVPAIAMRLIADERKTGTIELLLIRPIGVWRIVLAKYLAGLTLVLVSIAPTIVYAIVVDGLSVSETGIDVGGTIGSYIALVFLAATYMSVGLFASSLTDNQIVAFVVAAALCALLYIGFDMFTALSPQSDWAAALTEIGIASHYSSLSRGVIDSRDVVYFVSVALLMLAATARFVYSKQRSLA
ncbi:MAG: gliding motility-associated ABC transporter permease subunit GldF [Bacteroidales bacterium]|nr:gliding motility-associated ABC transporter permease subunit GldF [Bacteroidales bacterium]